MSQSDAILADLERGELLTPLDALKRYGCLRLAARIADLRGRGHQIETVPQRGGGKQWAGYRLLIRSELFPDLEAARSATP